MSPETTRVGSFMSGIVQRLSLQERGPGSPPGHRGSDACQKQAAGPAFTLAGRITLCKPV